MKKLRKKCHVFNEQFHILNEPLKFSAHKTFLITIKCEIFIDTTKHNWNFDRKKRKNCTSWVLTFHFSLFPRQKKFDVIRVQTLIQFHVWTHFIYHLTWFISIPLTSLNSKFNYRNESLLRWLASLWIFTSVFGNGQKHNESAARIVRRKTYVENAPQATWFVVSMLRIAARGRNITWRGGAAKFHVEASFSLIVAQRKYFSSHPPSSPHNLIK